MNADRERIIDKIKKCLRLSKSSNEHEAAAALRQARKLMDQIEMSEAERASLDAAETSAKSGAGMTPPNWEVALANLIKLTCGCELIFSGARYGTGEYLFIGCHGRDQVAAYAFTVLRRRIKSARADYIKSNLRRCKPRPKLARADAFCNGFISTVQSKIERMLINEAEQQAIKAYCGRYLTQPTKGIDRAAKSRRTDNDFWSGRRAGTDVDLRTPMSGGKQEALEG